MLPRLGGAARREYRRLARVADMPAKTHQDVVRTTGIRVASDDGAALLTDHWHAEGSGGDTILIRTPYGRDGIAGVALFLAERGHHVVVQSCRGTFGSGGTFDPLHDEVADGQATMRWLRAQPWATGRVHSWGGSYFGVTQWAYCDGDDRPDALGIAISARRFDDAILYPGGGFSIDTPLTWAYALDIQERALPSKAWALLRARRGFRRGALAVPPADAVRVARGADPQFYRDWVEHSDQGDPWWEPMHFAQDVDSIPPVTLVAGWQDLFLVGQLDDYAALRDAGRPVRLIVGDWVHGAPDITVIGVREVLRSFTGTAQTEGVRIDVTGGGGWRELDSWPPPYTAVELELTRDGRLDGTGVASPAADLTYRYDPVAPTPDAGGRTLNPFSAGRRPPAHPRTPGGCARLHGRPASRRPPRHRHAHDHAVLRVLEPACRSVRASVRGGRARGLAGAHRRVPAPSAGRGAHGRDAHRRGGPDPSRTRASRPPVRGGVTPARAGVVGRAPAAPAQPRNRGPGARPLAAHPQRSDRPRRRHGAGDPSRCPHWPSCRHARTPLHPLFTGA
ncbi:CocE/NonD family hydrolase [Microbacterium oxydans]|nr:CocE/NonD family hydrolase [Microbacterium oxydans]